MHRTVGIRTAILFASVSLLFVAAPVGAALIIVEPDDYPASSPLTNVSPYVTLMTLKPGDVPEPLFVVTSAPGDSATTDLSPTGSRVFAHVDIPFFNTIRKLQATFNGTTSSVSIAFAGGTPLDTDTGRLEVYGTSGNLLDAVETGPIGYGQFTNLTIARPTADIARAVMYSGENEFGRFDALGFETPVPEPTGAIGGVIIAGMLMVRRSRKGK